VDVVRHNTDTYGGYVRHTFERIVRLPNLLPDIKAYGGGEVQLQAFLTSALGGGECSDSPLPSGGEKPPVSIGKEGRSIPEMIWTLKVYKNISSCQESKQDSSVVQ